MALQKTLETILFNYSRIHYGERSEKRKCYPKSLGKTLRSIEVLVKVDSYSKRKKLHLHLILKIYIDNSPIEKTFTHSNFHSDMI